MAGKVRVEWFGTQAKRKFKGTTQDAVELIAVDVQERARRLLRDAPHIDTNFLHESVYVSTPKGTTDTPPSGIYVGRDGRAQTRERGEIVTTNKGAIVGGATDYAIYIELLDSFLYKGLLEAKNHANSTLAGVRVA